MKLAWATDVHLNFLEPPVVRIWCSTVTAWAPDALLLGGDIAEAESLEPMLRIIEERFARPVYFVLGNHDYYKGSIAAVQARVRAMCASSTWLRWLDDCPEPIALTERTGLVGHGGWGDARHGDFLGSKVRLNDYVLIEDLAGVEREALRVKLNLLGDAGAAHLRRVLPVALARFEHVVVLTHVPPFREACWHENCLSDDAWAPHFTCKAVGDALLEVAAAHPHRSIAVLCGHTHGAGECWPLPNLVVRTGGAEYEQPAAQAPIVVR
jgi:Icc protein